MAAAGASGLYVNPNTGAAQAGLMPFRNALINGDMRINQRGTSTNLASMTAVAAASPGSWVVDRWNTLRNAFVTGGTMGQGAALTTSDLPYLDAGITTFSRIGRTNTNALTNTINLMYYMETQDSIKYAGKKITLSFYYRTGANFSSTALSAYIFQGTGQDQNLRVGFTNEAGLSINCNTSLTWQRISFTITVSATTTQLAIRFLYIPVGTAGAADYFDITGVQLELGSVATPFEVRPYPVELQLCMRYYEKSYNTSVAPGTSASPGGLLDVTATSALDNILYVLIRFSVIKRGSPIMLLWSYNTNNSNTWTYARSGVGGTTVTPTYNYGGNSSVIILVNVGAAFVAAECYGHWTADAEL